MNQSISKRKLVLYIILLLAFCGLIFVLMFYFKKQNSIWSKADVNHFYKMKKVQLAQDDFLATEYLEPTDKMKLFLILCNTQKYNNAKDESYLLDGYHLSNPSIRFHIDDTRYILNWDYEKGIIHYSGTSDEKETYYYINKKNAAKLKKLFDKYINLQGVSRQ